MESLFNETSVAKESVGLKQADTILKYSILTKIIPIIVVQFFTFIFVTFMTVNL